MRIKKRLGEMLVESGLLTEDQLQQALADHKKVQIKLGQWPPAPQSELAPAHLTAP